MGFLDDLWDSVTLPFKSDAEVADTINSGDNVLAGAGGVGNSDPNAEVAQEAASQDTSSVSGVWISAPAYFTTQQSGNIGQKVTDGLTKKGYIVLSVNVSPGSRTAPLTGQITVKVDSTIPGPIDSASARNTLMQVISQLGYGSLSDEIAAKSGELQKDVVDPFLDELKGLSKKAGIGLLVIGGIVAALYLLPIVLPSITAIKEYRRA